MNDESLRKENALKKEKQRHTLLLSTKRRGTKSVDNERMLNKNMQHYSARALWHSAAERHEKGANKSIGSKYSIKRTKKATGLERQPTNWAPRWPQEDAKMMTIKSGNVG